MILKLEIFFNTEETSTLRNVGVDYTLRHCTKREMTFYNVNAISPYVDDDGEEYCTIHANGDEFIANASYGVVSNLIILASGLK